MPEEVANVQEQRRPSFAYRDRG